MSTEIEIQKRCICLRNNNEVWINEETYQKFKLAKEQANGNVLIYISEIDREVNTADIVEICTAEQMGDKRRRDRGEYRCAYGKWHQKKEVCDCFRRMEEKKREQERIKQEMRENRPLTEEERKKRKEMMDRIGKDLRDKGIIKGEKNIEETGIKFEKDIKYSKDGNCIVCGEALPKGCANVCSGGCALDRDANPEKYQDKLKEV